MRNKKGYSILEMVLTLAIVSGVAYAVLSYYRSEKKDRAIRENAQQIETIFKASDSYLIGLKADGSNQDRNKISMQILKNMNALPINLGAFTKQEILVDTLPAVQTPEPETNDGPNQPEEPETVPETPPTPETPIVDNVSFPDELLKNDPVVVDNPVPVEPTPQTPVEITPEPSIPVEPTEPVEDDTTTGAVINPVVITSADMKGFLISYTWIGGIYLPDGEYSLESIMQFIEQYNLTSTGISGAYMDVPNGTLRKVQKLSQFSSGDGQPSFPVLISSSDGDDLALMKVVFIMAVGYYKGVYPYYQGYYPLVIPSSIEEAVSIILNMTSSQGTIRWYNTENATTSNIMSKFNYIE